VLGGTMTLLGSSVNLLASEVSEKLGYGAFGLFSFTGIGIGVWLVGSLVMALLSDRFLPDRGSNDDDLVSNLSASGYLTEVMIPAGSELVGQSLHNSRLQRRFDVDVLELHRGQERFTPPLADRPLREGDRLLLRCTRADLLRLQQEHTILLAPRRKAPARTPTPWPAASAWWRCCCPRAPAWPGDACATCASASVTTPRCWPCAAATPCCGNAWARPCCGKGMCC